MAKDSKGNEIPQSESATQAAQIAELQAQVAQLAALLQKQAATTPDTLWAKQELRNQAIEQKQEQMAAYISLPSSMRSQYEANRMFDKGGKIFSVLVGTGKKGENPQLFIRADVESDAKARYQVVCGINHIVPDERHLEFSRWTVIDVTNDPAARKAVDATWTYQPAA